MQGYIYKEMTVDGKKRMVKVPTQHWDYEAEKKRDERPHKEPAPETDRGATSNNTKQ